MELLSTSQACRLLECSEMFLRKRIKDGRLAPYSVEGGDWIEGKRMWFHRADIEAFREAAPADDGREWVSVEVAAELLGIDRLSVYRIGRQQKLLQRPVPGPTVNGRHAYEFERESLEAYAQRVRNWPQTEEERQEWMPIKEAMTALGLTRHAIKKRADAGLLDERHYGPPEKSALYLRRSQVEVQVTQRPNYARRSDLPTVSESEIEVARFAGLFAGEGCVNIYRRQEKGYVYWQMRINMPNSSLGDLKRAQKAVGGRLCFRKRQKAHYRDQWVWQADGDTALSILRRIRPYLEVGGKAEQADLAIEFQERLRSKSHGRWAPLPPGEQEWREAQKEKISRLNRPNVPRD